MKSIKITHDIRNELKEYVDYPMNYDAIINRLIHDVADIMPIVENENNPINVGVHEDTMEKLKAYRLSVGESYENIIIRMLLASKTLYNSDDK